MRFAFAEEKGSEVWTRLDAACSTEFFFLVRQAFFGCWRQNSAVMRWQSLFTL